MAPILAASCQPFGCFERFCAWIPLSKVDGPDMPPAAATGGILEDVGVEWKSTSPSTPLQREAEVEVWSLG